MVVVSLSRDQLDAVLVERLDSICAALHTDPVDAAALEAVGAALVPLGYLGAAGLRTTAEVVGPGLLGLPEFADTARYAARIATGLGVLSAGFLDAERQAQFDQQERARSALVKAVGDAARRLVESEARFDEVVSASASGVLVLDPDGRVSRANDAAGDTLGRPSAELTGTVLYDLVHPDSTAELRHSTDRLRAGEVDRAVGTYRLLRANGDVARITMRISLLRDAGGAPGSFVAVVQDSTELALLRRELHRQALHDVRTGLPNRQYFGTRLEEALRHADPAHGVTVLRVDLDAFGLMCSVRGDHAGDRLLRVVGQRLQDALSPYDALVARLDSDEFGIIVENTADTPDAAAIVEVVNRELSEPTFVDGAGLALTAGTGLVLRPPPDTDPDEVLRRAGQALRWAKANGRGQWALYHSGQDIAERTTLVAATEMPGAWELGETVVRHRPVHSSTGGLAMVEALLRWDRPAALDDHMAYAEPTGLSVTMVGWQLRTAAEQHRWWRRRRGTGVPLLVTLTAHQSADADLVGKVRRALDETGLPAPDLTLAMPTHAVASNSTAADNLDALAGLGVRAALDGFRLAPEELPLVEDLPIAVVRLSPTLTRHRHIDAAAHLVPLLRDAGAEVAVDGIASAAEARAWSTRGAALFTGPHIGEPFGVPGTRLPGTTR
ncbi:diguanylate cyclase domain-containing protein [Saccharothrix lopnurensis]|uniref:Diguanylate cyclase domain-containing protein n=1 Tax=Saccharothrix lopnurensis TaxID=1670621 RepID=A0ABW1PC82_9PSEU